MPGYSLQDVKEFGRFVSDTKLSPDDAWNLILLRITHADASYLLQCQLTPANQAACDASWNILNTVIKHLGFQPAWKDNFLNVVRPAILNLQPAINSRIPRIVASYLDDMAEATSTDAYKYSDVPDPDPPDPPGYIPDTDPSDTDP